MHVNVLADELAEIDIPDVLRVGSLITALYGCTVTTYSRPGMFRRASFGGRLDPKDYAAGGPTVALTGYDLQPSGLNFAFGVTQGEAVLVSTARIQGDIWRLVALTLHEVGHLLGLVDAHCSNHDNRHYFEGHCRNDCVMQAINSLTDLDRCVADLVQGISLCGDCREILRKK